MVRELPGYPFNLKALITRGIIVFQRKLFGINAPLEKFGNHTHATLDYGHEEAQEALSRLIKGDKPFLAARFGILEMEAILRHIDVTAPANRFSKAIDMMLGRRGPFWWDNSIRGTLCWTAGYFPPDTASMNAFGARALQDCQQIDLLLQHVEGESRIMPAHFPNAKVVGIRDIDTPFWEAKPWTKALAGKKVLLVHPFAKTITSQYEKRKRLFKDPEFLPDFTLLTYHPYVTQGGEKSPYPTWIESLDHMIEDISKLDFDIAIIGAGAYGMSIGAAIKRAGKKAIHLGGATQTLFGIKGGRYDNSRVGREIYNEYWVRPSAEETPKAASKIEDKGYW